MWPLPRRFGGGQGRGNQNRANNNKPVYLSTLSGDRPLCADYQHGKCTARERGCPRGQWRRCARRLPNGKPCGVPDVAQGVPCPGSSAPSSSPTVTYNISNSYNTTTNYSYATNAGGAGATRATH